MKYLTKEVKIGITGIIALFILIYGINYLKGIQLLRPDVYFYVKYKDINGLPQSSPVFADGYRVGIVRNIYYDYKTSGNVTVEIGLDTDLRIPKGSSAELVFEMLGGVRMNLLLANNPRESYSVGDTIPGILNGGLMNTVAEFMPQVEGMIPKMDSILTSLNAILSNPDIPAALHSIKNTAEGLEATGMQLKKVMYKDVPQLTEKLNNIEDNIVIISGNLKEIDYASTIKEIDTTIANIKVFTDNLNNKDSSLNLLLNNSQLYNNLDSTFANASDLLKDMKHNPQRYVHFSLFGGKQK
jgi:phospholipid/cholesterol/gamma-HCH transport system substrate-binding protein